MDARAVDIPRIARRVRHVVARVLDLSPKEVHDESRLGADLGVGADGLGPIELLDLRQTLEKTFRITIHDEWLPPDDRLVRTKVKRITLVVIRVLLNKVKKRARSN